MKTFREHIKEEVKIGALASGGIDIEREAIRDEINGILSAIAVRPCVTPYGSLNKIRKALAYFSIFLPKRVYLEGRHGVEVWEINQFGDKMGFTDSGEWIHHVPAKYYLFFHYHRIGSMYYLEAKIVDDKELESRVNAAEKMFAEETDAAARQEVAKAGAPKEKAHTALGDCDCSQGDSPSTKDAVKVSMKKKIEEEMSHGARELATYADNHAQLHRSSHQPIVKNLQRKHAKGTYDHGKAEKLWGYHAKRASDAYHKEHGHKFSVGERKEAAKHMADSARDDHGFGTVKEGRMPASVIKHKQKLAGMTPEEKKKHFAGKSEEELKSMARRHGYGKDSDEYSKHVTKMQEDKDPCWKGYEMVGMKKKGGRQVPNCVPVKEEEQIDEKAPPGAKFERMVKHIKKGYSKDGLTKKEKGIAYATAWKAKKRESED